MSSTDFEHLGYRITQDDTDGMVWIQSPAGAVIDRAPFVSEAVEMVDALARAPVDLRRAGRLPLLRRAHQRPARPRLPLRPMKAAREEQPPMDVTAKIQETARITFAVALLDAWKAARAVGTALAAAESARQAAHSAGVDGGITRAELAAIAGAASETMVGIHELSRALDENS